MVVVSPRDPLEVESKEFVLDSQRLEAKLRQVVSGFVNFDDVQIDENAGKK